MFKPVILIGRDCYDNLIDCYGNPYVVAEHLSTSVTLPCVGLFYQYDGEPFITALFADVDSFKKSFVEQKELESFYDSITAM